MDYPTELYVTYWPKKKRVISRRNVEEEDDEAVEDDDIDDDGTPIFQQDDFKFHVCFDIAQAVDFARRMKVEEVCVYKFVESGKPQVKYSLVKVEETNRKIRKQV